MLARIGVSLLIMVSCGSVAVVARALDISCRANADRALDPRVEMAIASPSLASHGAGNPWIVLAASREPVSTQLALSKPVATRDQISARAKRDPFAVNKCIAIKCSPPGIQRTNHCLKLLQQAHLTKRSADYDAVLACGRAAFEADSACERQCLGP